MSMWNHYRSIEEFEREELWASDLTNSSLAGLDDGCRGDPDRLGGCDEERLDELDFDLD